MSDPIEDKRVYELDEQTSLVSGDQFLLDNVGLAEARRIDQANLISAISDGVLAQSPLKLAQSPPVDEDWRPIVYDIAGLNVPEGVGNSISFKVDLSSYITDEIKGAWLLVFAEETGGAANLEVRVSPLDTFPTGVIVATEIQGGSVFVSTFTALDNSTSKRFYVRFISIGGVSIVNAEINLLAAL